MSSRCICYITDSSYLFPTLVSAMQARSYTPADIADVAIFSVDISKQQEKAFARIASAENLLFLPLSSDQLEGAGAMLARLFLGRIAPERYDHLLYIDGDTQITGSLAPLLETDVPAGRFCAVNDPMTFSLHRCGRNNHDLAAYFCSLGLNDAMQKNYFNTGVLRINRAGWDDIGREAWTLFQKLRGKSRYPDQDALNLASIDRRIPISFRWNFPVFLRNARLESAISPRIIHYMGNPKPWHGQFPPWGPAERESYLTVLNRYPALTPFLNNMPIKRQLKYVLQQNYKKVVEMVAWGGGYRYREILHYEDGARREFVL